MTQSEQEPSAQERFNALALFLARTMVPEEDAAVSVNSWVDENVLRVIINVPEEYRGRLIGRNGHVIRSLRTLAGSTGIVSPYRVELDLAE